MGLSHNTRDMMDNQTVERKIVEKYGEHIISTKVYEENNIIRLKFANQKKVMWLKKEICREFDLKVQQHLNSKIYWFEPA